MRIGRWAIFIDQFDVKTEHRPENSMKDVHALSRNPVEILLVNENQLAQKNDQKRTGRKE